MPKKLLEFRANDMSLGLNLQSDRRLELGEIDSGRSARYERGSAIFTGPGFRESATPTASVRIDSMIEATVFPAIWIKNGTTVQYSTDAVTFYSSGATVTDDTRTWVKQDGDGNLFLINQTDNPHRFPVSKLATALSASDATIDLGDSAQVAKFSTTNPQTVRINGTAYTYTGTSGATLTGVQEGGGAVTTAQSVDSLVVQQLSGGTELSTFTEEKGNVMMELESRLIVGGVKDKEHIAYYSAAATLANPEFFWDFDANGASQKYMPGKITGMISGLGKGYIFNQKEVHQAAGFDTATSGLLTSPISSTYGCYNPRCVVDMDGVIAFMGQRRLIPITLQLTPDASAAPFLGEDFDSRIRPWLESHDDSTNQGDAFLKWDSAQKILKIGAVVGGALQTYVYDAQAKAFAPAENRSVASSTMFLGNSYFGHRDNGKIYQDDIGRTNDGVPIAHRWSTGRIEHDKGRKHMQAYKFEMEGWMTEASEFTWRVFIDGSSAAAVTKEFDDDVIVSTQGTALGVRGVGVNTIGLPEGIVEAYPFRANIILRGLEGEDYKFEWEVTKDGSFVQLNNWFFSAYDIKIPPHKYE